VGQWAPERILSLNAPYRGVVACHPLGAARNLSEVWFITMIRWWFEAMRSPM